VKKIHTSFATALIALATIQCSGRATTDEPSKPAAAAALAPDEVAAPAVRVPVDGLPSFGNADAPLTIVAFTDYECPFCSKADGRIDALRAEYGDRVRVVIAPTALPMHARAKPAARAFLAAVEQGRGEAMHSFLFAHQDQLDDEGLRGAAAAVGLDSAAFERAFTGESTEAVMTRSKALAAKLGVTGTPTFFVNGRRLVGARSPEAFRAVIDEELGKADKMGVPRAKVYTTLMAGLPEAVPVKAPSPISDKVVEVRFDGAPLRGVTRAPVTMVLFSDFECPYCARLEDTLRTLEEKRRGEIKIAFRHRPLPFHQHARLAAKASIAAEQQNRFWEYHDLLIVHADGLEREALEKYAAKAGLDRARFARDLDDPALDKRLDADLAQAEALDIKGTPTTFVNGRRIVGSQPIDVYLTAIDAALGRK